jgi:predicted permease
LSQVFTSALGAVLTLFIFMAGGFLFAKKGLVKPEFSAQISGVVFKFFFPLMLLKIILLQTELGSLAEGAHLMLISVLTIVAGMPLGWLLSRLLKGRAALPAVQFATMFPNYIFMGMPVVLAMYGEAASQTMVIYTLPMNLLVSTLGYMVLASSGRVNWKSAVNPCTISIAVGFAWLALGIPVPDFLASVFTMGSNVVSPMAMFQVGLVIAGFKLTRWGALKDAALLSLVRLLVLPTLIALALFACGLRGLYLSVPAMVTAMPVAANMTITAGAIGRHEEVSAQLVFVSTVMSLITIPVMAVIINAILGMAA